MTAKDTHFNKKTIASYLIEATGAIPIKRAQDHPGTKVGEYNQKVFEKLIMVTPT
jgi:glycerol-3-phosphate O-acyltransferase/dihydroxyacetone phosphate acyltransferase